MDYSFHEKHYFTTYQSSITSDAHEYWREVDILANQTGSIFDTPPAEIKGNIFNVKDTEEKVFGYFQAANQTQDRFYLLPYDFPFPLTMESCTYYWYKDEYPTRCLDCLTRAQQQLQAARVVLIASRDTFFPCIYLVHNVITKCLTLGNSVITSGLVMNPSVHPAYSSFSACLRKGFEVAY